MWAVGDMGVGDVDGLGLPVVRRCGQSGDVDARGCGRSGDVGVRECGRLGDVGGQGCVGGYGCQEVQAVGAAGGQGMRAVLGDVGSWGLPAVGGCRRSGGVGSWGVSSRAWAVAGLLVVRVLGAVRAVLGRFLCYQFTCMGEESQLRRFPMSSEQPCQVWPALCRSPGPGPRCSARRGFSQERHQPRSCWARDTRRPPGPGPKAKVCLFAAELGSSPTPGSLVPGLDPLWVPWL